MLLWLGNGNTLKGMNRKRVEELMSHDERRLLGADGNCSDIFCPNNGETGVFAHAMIPNLGLGHGRLVAAKKVFLRGPQLGTGFDHVNSLDAISHRFEVANGLFPCQYL